MKGEGLKVNMKETKILISGPQMNTLKDTDRWTCGVCRSGVGRNSLAVVLCRLREDETYRFSSCRGFAHPIDCRPCDQINLNNDKLVCGLLLLPWRHDLHRQRLHSKSQDLMEWIQGVETYPDQLLFIFQLSWKRFQLLCVTVRFCSMPASAGQWEVRTSLLCWETTELWSGEFVV